MANVEWIDNGEQKYEGMGEMTKRQNRLYMKNMARTAVNAEEARLYRKIYKNS